ncbi:MAG TPA: hypothetical protein VGR57_04570 [Ktedonobacterales bacterium]|nr:hypothetical protein [Ktedonobacterales bacterium]
MTTRTTPTWDNLITTLAAEMHRWTNAGTWQVQSVFTSAPAAQRRRAGRAGQSPEERTVTLTYSYWRRYTTRSPELRSIQMTVSMEPTALENLRVLVDTITQLRTLDRRHLMPVAVKLLRQMYPADGPTKPSPAPPRHPGPAGPEAFSGATSPSLAQAYAALYLVPSAPLAVAEASYRKLATSAHRDVGGSDEHMKRLNLAIAAIRGASK